MYKKKHFKQNFMFHKKGAGFTLVELLVVISIIGILSSFAVVSLNSARMKARDALRKGDMAQLRTAIILYYDNNDETYPICGTWDGGAADFGANADSADDSGSSCYFDFDGGTVGTLTEALTSGSRPYTMNMPKDPKNSNNVVGASGGSDIYIYRYVSDSDGGQYALVYETEDSTDDSPQVIRGW